MSLDLPSSQYYLLFALSMLLMTLAFVPRTEIRRLFWLGLLFGSGIDFVWETVYSLLGVTRYEHIKPFSIGGLSLWTIAAWAPTMMLFLYFLPKREEKYIYWIYVVAWSAVAAFVGTAFEHLGLLVYVWGGPWIWFVGGLVYFSVGAKYYRFIYGKSEGS